MKMSGLIIILLFGANVQAKNPNPFHGVTYDKGVKAYNFAFCVIKQKVNKCTTNTCKKTELNRLKLFYLYFDKTYGAVPPESTETCN